VALRQLAEDPAISSGVGAGQAAKRRLRFSRHTKRTAAAVVVAAVAVTLGFVFWPSSNGPPLGPEARAFYDRGKTLLRDRAESGTLRTLDDAIAYFHRALSHEPDAAIVLAGLGEAYWLRCRSEPTEISRDEAQRAVDRAYELDPDLPEVRNARGLGYMALGNYRLARDELVMALKADDEFASAWANLGEAHTELGDYSAAREALTRALELEPGSADIRILFGIFYQRFGEYDEAVKYYRAATDLKPDDVTAWNDLGAALLHTEQIEEAIAVFERSIQIKDTGTARSNLGTSLYLLERFDEAQGHYEKATTLEPDRSIHWCNLGDVLTVLGRNDQAAAAHSRAADAARVEVSLRPDEPAALARLARYCARAGQVECALEYAQRALALQPRNPEILLANAVVHALLGRDGECLDFLERAVKLGISRASIEAVPEFSRLHNLPRFKSILDLAS
jgi:tetratricopeptide (TPR) repeat protein